MKSFIFSLAVVGLLLTFGHTARADTQYDVYGTGRTYQNNVTYSCVSWGYAPGQSYCYLGVWSDTQYQLNNVVEVREWGQNLDQNCDGSPPYQVCSDIYLGMYPDPLTVDDQSIAATNGAHYDSDSWPSNTKGTAWHRNYTYSSTETWWTTGDGGN